MITACLFENLDDLLEYYSVHVMANYKLQERGALRAGEKGTKG